MKTQFKRLLTHFDMKDVPAQFFEDWQSKVSRFSNEIIAETVTHYIENFPPNRHKFPTINDFYLIADSIETNMRKKKEREEEERAFDRLTNPGTKGPVGRDFCVLIRNFTRGQLTRREYAKGMESLIKKHGLRGRLIDGVGIITPGEEVERYKRGVRDRGVDPDSTIGEGLTVLRAAK